MKHIDVAFNPLIVVLNGPTLIFLVHGFLNSFKKIKLIKEESKKGRRQRRVTMVIRELLTVVLTGTEVTKEVD